MGIPAENPHGQRASVQRLALGESLRGLGRSSLDYTRHKINTSGIFTSPRLSLTPDEGGTPPSNKHQLSYY
jgi:hypothetical protein